MYVHKTCHVFNAYMYNLFFWLINCDLRFEIANSQTSVFYSFIHPVFQLPRFDHIHMCMCIFTNNNKQLSIKSLYKFLGSKFLII